MMNYTAMKQVAIKLLSNFGNVKSCSLVKKEGSEIVKYKGKGVKLDYNSEAVGSNDNMIEAGDAKLLCLFEVPPREMVDIIEFAGSTFNIINAGTLNPNGQIDVLYTLQIRKA